MEKVIIIGGKGSAVVVAEQLYDMQIKTGKVEFLGFAFDDETYGDNINGFPILCKTFDAFKKFQHFNDVKFIYQLYRPDLMKERIALLSSYNIPLEKFYTFIHQSVVLARSAKVGYGTAIMANSVVNPNSYIGNHCTVHSNTLIGHDTRVGSYNFIAAHNVIGSSVLIGDGNFFGMNSSFNNYIQIGDYNFIGMASNVIKGLNSDQKVYGNPAKEFTKDIKPL